MRALQWTIGNAAVRSAPPLNAEEDQATRHRVGIGGVDLVDRGHLRFGEILFPSKFSSGSPWVNSGSRPGYQNPWNRSHCQRLTFRVVQSGSVLVALDAETGPEREPRPSHQDCVVSNGVPGCHDCGAPQHARQAVIVAATSGSVLGRAQCQACRKWHG